MSARVPLAEESFNGAAEVAQYDRGARLYMLPEYKYFVRKVRRRGIRGGRVLDIGTGSGRLAIELARAKGANFEITGIDISEDMLRRAGENARRAGVADKLEFIQANADALPFPDKYFDLVVSYASLHHWLRPERVFREARRVARDGGTVIIRDNKRTDGNILWGAFIWGLSRLMNKRHRRNWPRVITASYTVDEMKEMLADEDLKDYRVGTDFIRFDLCVETRRNGGVMVVARAASVTRVKAELQEKGLRLPPELAGELAARYNAPAVSTGRLVLCLESPAGNGDLVPVFIVNGKRGETSPYHLVKSETGRFQVWQENEKYADVTFFPRPAYYDRVANGGTPMSQLAVIVGPGHLRSVVSQRCCYQQNGEACKFCAVQHWWNAVADKAPEQIAETVTAAYEEGVASHISLTTATAATPDRGLRSLVTTARLIQQKAPMPIMLEFEPVPDHSLLKSLLVEAKEAGVTTVSINIECWDKSLREEVMPAKGKIAIQEYFENWKICRDAFGANQVATVAVVGIGESDASILWGVEKAAAAGVMTFLVPHSPATGAAYQDMTPPSADRMLALYERAAAIHQKYNLDMYAVAAGCVRGGGFSAIKDVARFGA